MNRWRSKIVIFLSLLLIFILGLLVKESQWKQEQIYNNDRDTANLSENGQMYIYRKQTTFNAVAKDYGKEKKNEGRSQNEPSHLTNGNYIWNLEKPEDRGIVAILDNLQTLARNLEYNQWDSDKLKVIQWKLIDIENILLNRRDIITGGTTPVRDIDIKDDGGGMAVTSTLYNSRKVPHIHAAGDLTSTVNISSMRDDNSTDTTVTFNDSIHHQGKKHLYML